MADKKISELTELTTPDGTEELVVNDSGVSKKVQIDNLLAGGTISNFTSTGIDDNATSTAITIDASENTAFAGDIALTSASSSVIRQTSASSGDIVHYFDLTGSDSSWAIGLDNSEADGFNFAYGATGSPSLTAGKVLGISTGGDVTVSTGNLVIGTSGKGIDFSATSDGSGTMTSEVLDDYEEGVWTPTITFATPGDLSVAYHANTNATYTKVGRLVTISFYVRTTTFSHSTASGDLSILGIPFTPRTYTGMKSEGGTTYYGLNKSGFTQATVLVNSASSIITMSAVGIAGSSISTVNANDAPGVGGRVDISGVISYETDS